MTLLGTFPRLRLRICTHYYPYEGSLAQKHARSNGQAVICVNTVCTHNGCLHRQQPEMPSAPAPTPRRDGSRSPEHIVMGAAVTRSAHCPRAAVTRRATPFARRHIGPGTNVRGTHVVAARLNAVPA